MNTLTLADHPAIVFGDWLRQRRLKAGMVATAFAEKVWLSPAKYAEVEHGVVRWLGKEQETLIPMALGLDRSTTLEFNRLLATARSARPLEFADIFSEDDLQPLRACQHYGNQPTLEECKALITQVFKPLV